MFRFFHRHPALMTVVIAVLVSSPAYLRQEQAIEKAEEATEALVVQRTEARRLTCEKDRRFAEAHNALVESHNEFVLLMVSGGEEILPPETLAIVEAERQRNNRNLVTVPDCSPEELALLPGEPDEGDKP